MRAQRLGPWLWLVTVLLLAACQSFPLLSTPTPMAQISSGVHLIADITLPCGGTAQPDAECVQPYTGEFVITALNGAEVARLVTDETGQATIDLPPGQYILGVKTENLYPQAAPIKVDVLADQYRQVPIRLTAAD